MSFYLFSALTVIFSLLVIILRNPVSSALSLSVAFVSVAAIFIQLGAYFLSAMQVLVYAGAIMVLFLFIIMLIKNKTSLAIDLSNIFFAVVLTALFAVQFSLILNDNEQGRQKLANVAFLDSQSDADSKAEPQNAKETIISQKSNTQKTTSENSAQQTGVELTDTHLMGMSIYQKSVMSIIGVGVILLVATIGVVMLSSKDQEIS